MRYGKLQNLGSGGLTTEGPPALAVYEYDSKLPSSWQWNTGVQMMLPWSSSLDVAYVGQHSYNLLQNVNLNTVDFGAAFLAQNQDPTTPWAFGHDDAAGATAVSTDRMRAFRGYGAIQQQWGRGWRTSHSLQLSLQRRFRNGFSFGFNDTITLADHSNTFDPTNPGTARSARCSTTRTARTRSAPIRQTRTAARTDRPNRHVMKGNFVWDLPDITGSKSALKASVWW